MVAFKDKITGGKGCRYVFFDEVCKRSVLDIVFCDLELAAEARDLLSDFWDHKDTRYVNFYLSDIILGQTINFIEGRGVLNSMENLNS